MKKIMPYWAIALMTLNLLVTVVNAAKFTTVIGVFSAYLAISPILLAFKWIHPEWLAIDTEGKMSKHMRAMVLWPITLYEYHSHKRVVKKITVLVEALEQMNGDEIVKTQEWAELIQCRKKLSVFTAKAKKYSK
ncbi:hypothetical protein [Vibrio sp. THAF190c]|uniref:hypothetical protein n=1 Tax=Vibrio sp. THAF190c TaxID=2587865 RepID=UPI001267F0A3|nr:hypothetical protein [Vibrio sp. THAF190c]QFT13481.1 hypothetical protein FIV04_26360 [Vibrio sp. THAF190c]